MDGSFCSIRSRRTSNCIPYKNMFAIDAKWAHIEISWAHRERFSDFYHCCCEQLHCMWIETHTHTQTQLDKWRWATWTLAHHITRQRHSTAETTRINWSDRGGLVTTGLPYSIKKSKLGLHKSCTQSRWYSLFTAVEPTFIDFRLRWRRKKNCQKSVN